MGPHRVRRFGDRPDSRFENLKWRFCARRSGYQHRHTAASQRRTERGSLITPSELRGLSLSAQVSAVLRGQ